MAKAGREPFNTIYFTILTNTNMITSRCAAWERWKSLNV